MTTHVEDWTDSPLGPARYCWTEPEPVAGVPGATLSRGWWLRPDGSVTMHEVDLMVDRRGCQLTIDEAHGLGRALLALKHPAL